MVGDCFVLLGFCVWFGLVFVVIVFGCFFYGLRLSAI